MASNSWRIPANAKYPMSTGMRRSVLATSGACVQRPKVGGVSIAICGVLAFTTLPLCYLLARALPT